MSTPLPCDQLMETELVFFLGGIRPQMQSFTARYPHALSVRHRSKFKPFSSAAEPPPGSLHTRVSRRQA
jgi:hypothetical protein